MKTKISFLIAVVLLSSICTIKSQDLNNSSNENVTVIHDAKFGISFRQIGKAEQLDNSTYVIALSSNGNSSLENANAEVAKSDRLFIDLPNSFGGRLYLDSLPSDHFLENKVLIDSFDSGIYKFQREYWVVYAGMGMWDCVINCYTKVNGEYYIVSLVQNKRIGKPGLVVNDKALQAKDLRMEALTSLQNRSNTIISDYYKLLSSFQIN